MTSYSSVAPLRGSGAADLCHIHVGVFTEVQDTEGKIAWETGSVQRVCEANISSVSSKSSRKWCRDKYEHQLLLRQAAHDAEAYFF